MGKKNVNCSIGNPGSPTVRALGVLTRANDFNSESGFLVECFRLYCEELNLLKRDDEGNCKWNTKKLEKMEKMYPEKKLKRKGLRKDIGDEE